MLTALAAGWSGFALLLLVLMSQPLRMLAMRVVFKAFGVPQQEQEEWALKESKRNGMLDLARAFWNRPVAAAPERRRGPGEAFRAPRSADADEDAA